MLINDATIFSLYINDWLNGFVSYSDMLVVNDYVL